jgi:ATPase subunit of ABC transporter with duplicated ATPase domains
VIEVHDLTMEIGRRTLVGDGSFSVYPNEKVGLVGRNGTGKSSLVAVVIGIAPIHLRWKGAVDVKGTVGYLPQVPVPRGLGLEPTGFSHVLSARGLDVLDDELQRARVTMTHDPSQVRIARFSDLEEAFRQAGGYEVEGEIARLAEGLGLRQDLLLEDIASLSGGQRRRVDLIRVLFHRPDVMILDEPTNHLDRSAKRWLMDELARLPGSLLIISHDLVLLDRSITKVVHLANTRLREFKGNYSAFERQLAADIEQRERAHELEEREIRRLSKLADSMRASTEKRARKAKVLDRRVERIREHRTERTARDRHVTFRLPEPRRAGATPLVVRGLAVRYGPKAVLDQVEFAVDRGNRVLVVGRNGVGKSSLLRCLAGHQDPTEGSVDVGHNVSLGYFAQEHEQLDPLLSALEHVDDTIITTEAGRRSLLGSFGLVGAAAHQRPPSLSGGEKAKLTLAMLSAGKANVLVLDEPTNNLDPPSMEAVGTMFRRWSGTVVAVSHDPQFVEALHPTHALLLPDERYEFWRDEYLDLVAMR